ncbi:MAG: hypothetical protein L0241_00525 [Planctomycetia bacterium]|nr:hypothetical protein [Planctomycetia bacterium]
MQLSSWRRILLVCFLVVVSLATIGCGSGRERGKNSDFDRPTTEKK